MQHSKERKKEKKERKKENFNSIHHKIMGHYITNGIRAVYFFTVL
jgi:hypothetical protein